MEATDAVEFSLSKVAHRCAVHGVRFTELRRCVLSLIIGASGPITAYQLVDKLRVVRKLAAPPTVYRVLDFLLEQKLIYRVERLNAF